jgi:hypothetical protein
VLNAAVNRPPPSRHPQIFRRFLALVRDNVERDLGALDQRTEACFLHRRDMDEHVLAATTVRRNEPLTFLAVKPLHSSTRHAAPPFKPMATA